MFSASEITQAKALVSLLFRDDFGKPFHMTDGQAQLFLAIYTKKDPRVQFECYTQYGKSDIVSMAVLLRAATFPEKWAILGGSKDKAGIIMQKCIKHIFENDFTLGRFKIGDDETLERIKRERSKERVTFRVDDKGSTGEIVMLSAEARRVGEDAGDILIGHGSPNLIEDDAALIPDPIHGKALRMLGGHKDNFLLKVSNTFGRNHFYRSHNDDTYKVYKIDWRQGVAEGRVTESYIEEMRKELDAIMFGILYECAFPSSDIADDAGWMRLLTEEDIAEAMDRHVEAVGTKLLGVDVGQGVNFSTAVLRQNNYAKILLKFQERDPMKTAEQVRKTIQEEGIDPSNVFVDATSVGSGVVGRLHEAGLKVQGIVVGERAKEKTGQEKNISPIEFANQRAQLFWEAKEWIRQGGALEQSKDWLELTTIRWRENADRKVQIMPKEIMRSRGYISATASPDVADAFALSFSDAGPDWEEITRRVEQYNREYEAMPKYYYPELGI